MNCSKTCFGFNNLGIDACQGCAGNPQQKEELMSESKASECTTTDKLLVVIDPFGQCKHGMMRCACGVCTKHPMSVAIKGGHVTGTSSGNPVDLSAILGFG